MSAAGQVEAGSSPALVSEAAMWLATGGADKSKATVPQLRERFGLSALHAVQAIRESNLIKARSA